MDEPVSLVQDLIGRPWAEANCGEVARDALARLGIECPWFDFWLGQRTTDGDEAALEKALGRASSTWSMIDAPEVPGDIILSGADGPFPYHVSVCLGRVDGHVRVLTSSQKTGAIIVRASSVARVLGVWRWRPV